MLVKLINPPLQTTNKINTDHDVSGEGSPVAIVKRAVEDEFSYLVLDGVQISYRDVNEIASQPIQGSVTVKDGDKVILDIDINVSQFGLQLYIPISPTKDLTVTLHPGNSAAIGKLNIQTHVEMSA